MEKGKKEKQERGNKKEKNKKGKSKCVLMPECDCHEGNCDDS